MQCPECKGTFVAKDLSCLECHGGLEGPNCGSDGCPAFGIATENRCRCAFPPEGLPVVDFRSNAVRSIQRS